MHCSEFNSYGVKPYPWRRDEKLSPWLEREIPGQIGSIAIARLEPKDGPATAARNALRKFRAHSNPQ